MSQQGLEQFGAYQKARQLFDLVVKDMEALKTNPYVLSASLSADRQCGFDLCEHRRGLWKTEPNRSTFVFSISREVLLVRRVALRTNEALAV